MSSSSLASCASEGSQSFSTGASSNVSLSKEILFDKCPRCRIQFDFLKRSNNVSSKVPLILNCKHTVCEDCIRKMLLTNVTACPVCKEKFSVAKTQIDSLTEVFTPHYSLIGYLLWTKNSPTKGHINFVSTGLTLRNKQISGSEAGEGCSVIEAENSDEDIDDSDVERPELNLSFERCPEHIDTYLNIHCDNCDKNVCCYCFVENHGGHKSVSLYKLSDAELLELKLMKCQMEVMLRQLQLSRTKAKLLKNFDLTNIEADVRNCFFNLHAKLHLAEQNVKKRLQTCKLGEADLGVINSTLKSGIYRVTQILSMLNVTNTKQINVRALYHEVQDLKKFPCRLVSDQDTLDPLEVVTKSDFLDDIDDYFVFKKPENLDYTLIPIEDWSCVQIEDVDVSSTKPKISDVSVPKDNKEKSNEEVVKKNELPAREASSRVKKREQTNEGGRVKVNLTHVNNLNSFYVQKCSMQSALRNMNAHIGTKARKKIKSEDILLGRTYGVQYETKHSSHWRRGKLVDIIQKGPNNALYTMFFIDYGNTQHVTLDKLRELDTFIIKKAPYAFECKLYNPDNITFEPNAHLHLPQIIGEKELYVHFTKKQSGVQEVDLLVPTSNGSLISVRNILTKSVLPVPEKQDLLLPKNLKLFKNSKRFMIGQEERVMVTHVIDPFHISIQLLQNIDALEKMRREMKLFYEQTRYVSCIPVEDSDIAVKYDHEYQGNWHRGTVTSVDIDNQLVDVVFVDWGGSAVVPWSNIRLLTENFTKIECQALTVKLADIEKENLNEPWPQKTIKFLKEQVLIDNKFRMLVNDPDPLNVALFQIRPSADICLNTLLVKNGLAVSTGNISMTLYWPKDQEMDNKEEENDEFSYRLIKQSEEVLAEDDDIELKNGLKQQVSVVKFDSPDLIYIKFSKYKDIEDEMHKELHIHYSSSRKTKNSWNPEEYCVIFDASRKSYFRGIIKGSCGPDSYSVYLYDHAREVKVPKHLIYIQDSYFKRVLCNVVKCRLANIRPAGDKGEWSYLAIEMLQKIFANYKIIHIKKVEVNENQKMLGVIMWYSLTKPAKALEPAKLNLISINKSLIESGVAFSSTTPIPTTSRGNKAEEAEKQKAPTPESDKGTEESSKKSNENKKDWYDMICEDEELLTSASVTWPKPLPIQNVDFEATLTCVDVEGSFSVRDDDMHAIYVDLEANMDATFNSKRPPQDAGATWRPNEMCTIYEGNHWYRGSVIEVIDAQEVIVEMIDFGSAHTVGKDRIFKPIMYPDMPPLVNRVQLYDVYSKYGQWSASDVEEMLNIVTERVRVVVKGKLDDEIPPAEIYLCTGLSLNDLIIQRCPHLYRLENKAVLGNLEDEKDVDESDLMDEEEVQNELFDRESEGSAKEDEQITYTYAPFPESSKTKMSVVSVLKFGADYTVVLNVVNDDKKEASLEELKLLNDEIQSEVNKQPTMKRIEMNEPCVGFYMQKNMWSRAVIYDIENKDKGYVLAFFVDYGTVDMVTPENLKEMKPEWFQLPVYNRMAIIDVKLVQNFQAENVLMQLNNLRGKSVTVKVTCDDPLKVHLFERENLCYQNLIEYGIVKTF